MLTPRFGLDVHTFLVAAIAILVGVQVVGFGVIARHFAAANGLLPRSKSLDGLMSRVSLERGLLIALALCRAASAVSRGRSGNGPRSISVRSPPPW